MEGRLIWTRLRIAGTCRKLKGAVLPQGTANKPPPDQHSGINDVGSLLKMTVDDTAL